MSALQHAHGNTRFILRTLALILRAREATEGFEQGSTVSMAASPWRAEGGEPQGRESSKRAGLQPTAQVPGYRIG